MQSCMVVENAILICVNRVLTAKVPEKHLFCFRTNVFYSKASHSYFGLETTKHRQDVFSYNICDFDL